MALEEPVPPAMEEPAAPAQEDVEGDATAKAIHAAGLLMGIDTNKAGGAGMFTTGLQQTRAFIAQIADEELQKRALCLVDNMHKEREFNVVTTWRRFIVVLLQMLGVENVSHKVPEAHIAFAHNALAAWERGENPAADAQVPRKKRPKKETDAAGGEKDADEAPQKKKARVKREPSAVAAAVAAASAVEVKEPQQEAEPPAPAPRKRQPPAAAEIKKHARSRPLSRNEQPEEGSKEIDQNEQPQEAPKEKLPTRRVIDVPESSEIPGELLRKMQEKRQEHMAKEKEAARQQRQRVADRRKEQDEELGGEQNQQSASSEERPKSPQRLVSSVSGPKGDKLGYYLTLGAHPAATRQEIHNCYRKRALATHPDKPGGSEEAFVKVKDAYDVLGNAEERAKYDESSGTRGVATSTGEAATRDEANATKLTYATLICGLPSSSRWQGQLSQLSNDSLARLLRMAEQAEVTNWPKVSKGAIVPRTDNEGDGDDAAPKQKEWRSKGNGLIRRAGGYHVQISWRKFLIETMVVIPTLEQALNVHVALMEVRDVAQARYRTFKQHCKRFGCVEVVNYDDDCPPLLEEELFDVLREEPTVPLRFSSDLTRPAFTKERHLKTRENRIQSPFTASLKLALDFRSWIRRVLGQNYVAVAGPDHIDVVKKMMEQKKKEDNAMRRDLERQLIKAIQKEMASRQAAAGHWAPPAAAQMLMLDNQEAAERERAMVALTCAYEVTKDENERLHTERAEMREAKDAAERDAAEQREAREREAAEMRETKEREAQVLKAHKEEMEEKQKKLDDAHDRLYRAQDECWRLERERRLEERASKEELDQALRQKNDAEQAVLSHQQELKKLKQAAPAPSSVFSIRRAPSSTQMDRSIFDEPSKPEDQKPKDRVLQDLALAQRRRREEAERTQQTRLSPAEARIQEALRR